MPFLIAEGTSLALPTPKPTTPCPSPTTTSAEKLRFLPPLTTLVTRLMATTVSRRSSCDASMRSRVFITLKLQPRRTRCVGDGLDAPVIEEPVAVEHHLGDALGLQPLGNRFADGLGSLAVTALGAVAQRGLDRWLEAR